MVGAGYIGLEMAENLTRRGISVTLLELGSQVMLPADPEMVVPIQDELREQGVDLRLDTSVVAFEPADNDSITVVAKNHDDRFAADVVILAVGVRPDTRLAQEAGLEIGPTGGIRRGRSDAHQRFGHLRRRRCGRSARFRDRTAGALCPGRSGKSPGAGRRRCDLRPRRPLSRLAGVGRRGASST